MNRSLRIHPLVVRVTHWMNALLGGYEGARVVQFVAMSLTVCIIAVNVVMVAVVPRSLPAMITGRIRSDT